MRDLSIILPVYNEKDTLEYILKEWSRELKKSNCSFQFIICEDGSTDGTKELLTRIKSKYSLILNQTKEKRGYGLAVVEGIKSAKSSFILCVDSDGQCDPKDFAKFWKRRDTADVLIGWRQQRADTVSRKIYSGMFKFVFKLLFPISLHDPSAPFVLFKKNVVKKYLSSLLYLKEGFWWGFVATLSSHRYTFYELPIHHRNRIKGETKVYKLKKIPQIALSNLLGLLRLKSHLQYLL